MSSDNNISEEVMEEAKEEMKEKSVNSEAVGQNAGQTFLGENNCGDYGEKYKAQARAGYISGIVALLLTIVFLVVQYVIDGTTNYAVCATVFGMLAAENIVLYAGLKGKRNLILSVLYTLFAIGSAALTVINLLK